MVLLNIVFVIWIGQSAVLLFGNEEMKKERIRMTLCTLIHAEGNMSRILFLVLSSYFMKSKKNKV